MTLDSLLTPQNITILVHFCSAVVAGGLIGLERSYKGRAAGFRTHVLVCLASSVLMTLTMYQSNWVAPVVGAGTVNTDPTRMAQGIMTGIGFLGAGVIFREGITVRGLTTAASIWITASIGILIGVGMTFAAIIAVLLTLGTLSFFRQIERSFAKNAYVQHTLVYDKQNRPHEDEVRKMVSDAGFRILNISYRMMGDGRHFEYHMMIITDDQKDVANYCEVLAKHPQVREFSLTPSGD